MDIKIDNLCKSYGENIVLQNVSKELKQGSVCLLTGASGTGKTTLLHILLGLVLPDCGTFTQGVRYSAVFQENRLLPRKTPVENLKLIATKDTKKAELLALLEEILPADCLQLPVEQLSGGMQRRVAIARAMLAESDCVVMDEPFTGLDDETAQTVIAFIIKLLRGRTLLLSTHRPELMEKLQTEQITL